MLPFVFGRLPVRAREGTCCAMEYDSMGPELYFQDESVIATVVDIEEQQCESGNGLFSG